VTGGYVGGMGDTGDTDRRLAELSERVARMEERMKTMQATYDGALERFGKEAARRDTVNTRWTIAAIIGVAALGFATMSFIQAFHSPAQPIVIQLPPQTLAPVSQAAEPKP